MSFIALLAFAACGAGMTEISSDPGHNIDGDDVTDDSNTGSNETAMVYLEAGQTATWNTSTHKVENIRTLENVIATPDGPEQIDPVLTVTEIELPVAEWTMSYSYTMGDFTFVGDVTKDMEDSTDFTGELDTIDGLEGLKLSCDGTAYSDPFTTVFEELDGDSSTIDVKDINNFRANGPLLTKDSDNIAILTENGLYYAGHNGNVGDFYIECTFD